MQMKRVEFSKEKSVQLKKERDISFEEISSAINRGAFLKIVEHYNKKRYLNQRIFLVKVKGYIYVVRRRYNT